MKVCWGRDGKITTDKPESVFLFQFFPQPKTDKLESVFGSKNRQTTDQKNRLSVSGTQHWRYYYRGHTSKYFFFRGIANEPLYRKKSRSPAWPSSYSFDFIAVVVIAFAFINASPQCSSWSQEWLQELWSGALPPHTRSHIQIVTTQFLSNVSGDMATDVKRSLQWVIGRLFYTTTY